MAELYRLDFADGKSYIGITRHTAAKRFQEHSRAAASAVKGVVYEAWKTHGVPRLVQLAVISSEDMYLVERRAIARFGTLHPDGYNFTPGGDVPPSLTPQVAARISRALTGRVLPEVTRLKISAGLLGFKHTPETKARMSAAQRGKFVSAEARENMAKAKLGAVATDETRAKMTAAQRARRAAEGCKPQRKRYP